jgi:prepilin-type N-terminal cleavage/methylation domain-containing protein
MCAEQQQDTLCMSLLEKGTARVPPTKADFAMKVRSKETMEKASPHSRGKMLVSLRLGFRNGLIAQTIASSGFTLIELTIVLVVIGILAAIAIPNYVLMTARAKEAKVKQDAHCVQLAAELYASQNDGVYADANDGSIVANIVPLLPGQQRLKNAFSGNRTEPIVGPAANSGEIGYEARVGGGGVNLGYTITGFGRTLTVITLTGGF